MSRHIASSLLAFALSTACERGQPAADSQPQTKAEAPKVQAASTAAAEAQKPKAEAQAHDYGSAGDAATTPNTLLPIGAPIPKLVATTHAGERVNLGELGNKPVVVYFYPKDDTPGCTTEAKEIRDLWSEIQATGATVVGVSVDDEASHRAFAEKYQLPFLLLPDTDRSITKAFGVGLKSGRARRVTFVFAADGRLAKVFPEVTPTGHGREIVDAIRAARG